MSNLRAADLTSWREADSLWRLRASAPLFTNPSNPASVAKSLGLPSRGFASPLGFWFAPEEDWRDPPQYLMERAAPSRINSIARIKSKVPHVIATDSRRRVVVTDRQKNQSASGRVRRLDLAVDGPSARVEVDDVAWPEAGEASLLAVATCWRLEALDRCFDRFTDLARELLDRKKRRSPLDMIRRRFARGKGDSASQSRPRQESSFWKGSSASHRPISATELQRQGHSLILDLPELEGPLTDPARFVRSRASAWLYRRLCGKLGLFAWRDRIDERAEVLDGILDALGVRHDHRQVITLEILIILLLAIDIALSQFLGYWE